MRESSIYRIKEAQKTPNISWAIEIITSCHVFRNGYSLNKHTNTPRKRNVGRSKEKQSWIQQQGFIRYPCTNYHNWRKEKKSVGKKSSPKERIHHKQKVKVGGLNMTPQGQIPSPQASVITEENEGMPKVY
jgi:hypothetical protein